jgi:RNA polymerase sigma-70 factor, ECF subfamily
MQTQAIASPSTVPYHAEASSDDADGIARRHLTQLYGQALHLTANHHDALDLVQDTFETSLRKLPAGMPDDRVGFWLATVLRNRFIDQCRSSESRGRSKTVDAMEIAISTPEPTEEPSWASADPAKLGPLVKRLKPVFRQVFELRVHEGLSYAQIAVRLRIPISTVGTRYHRAVGCLRAALAREFS